MDQPSGPHSRYVYRRRRALAIAGAALVLVLVVWGLSAIFSGTGGTSGGPSGSQRVAAAGVTSPEAPSARPSSPPASDAPPSGTTASGTTPSGTTASASTSASASASAAARSSTSAAPPTDCPDSAIALAATVGKPSYPAQDRPKLGMTVINIGRKACTRDVGRGMRDLVVRSKSGKREWANDDCHFGDPEPDVKTLQPGQQLHYDLNWVTRTSAPGCPVERHDVPPGDYTLVAKLGDLTSAPTPFALT